MSELIYIKCSNPKCSAKFGVSFDYGEHYCSSACGVNKQFFTVNRKIDNRDFKGRQNLLNKVQEYFGLTNNELADELGVGRSVIASYLVGRYKIQNDLWERIVEYSEAKK